jgi:uncharacterized repeat protein (TIGR04076 family)
MERRNFIKTSAVGSACMLAGAAVSNDMMAQQSTQKFKCKITVLRTAHNKEWNQKFWKTDGGPCNAFSEGQEFLFEDIWNAPEGFCQWAWADIRTFIHKVNDGALDNFVSCCTDGFRPVFFKIERLEI